MGLDEDKVRYKSESKGGIKERWDTGENEIGMNIR